MEATWLGLGFGLGFGFGFGLGDGLRLGLGERGGGDRAREAEHHLDLG